MMNRCLRLHFISQYFIIAQEIWHLVRYDRLVTLMFTDYLRKVIKMLHGRLVHVAKSLTYLHILGCELHQNAFTVHIDGDVLL